MRIAITLLALLVTFGAARAKTDIGDIPPDDLGTDRNGAAVTVSANRGKVVVLSFWASWCTYCRKELPTLEKLQRAAGKAQLEVVGVNFKEDIFLFRKLIAGMKDSQMTFTLDRKGELGKQYGLHGLPFLVMIGRDGRIAHLHTGYDEKMLDQIIDELNGLLAAPAAVASSAAP
jgi:thiol-disulfide isomerase/thioredoxin